MRVSSKTGYGVQALFDMAFHGDGRAVQAREVAERQGVPLRYLEQILQELRRAGLVAAKRGPRGGYTLARPPEAIHLSEIVVALDGALGATLPFDGSVRDGSRSVDVPALVFRELAERIEGVLAGVTLRDLVVRAETLGLARATTVPQMYFI